MKIFAIIGLLFFAYCGMQVVAKWQYRSAIEKTLWFIAITVGGGYCLSVLLSRDNHQPITHPELAKSTPVTPWISNFPIHQWFHAQTEPPMSADTQRVLTADLKLVLHA